MCMHVNLRLYWTGTNPPFVDILMNDHVFTEKEKNNKLIMKLKEEHNAIQQINEGKFAKMHKRLATS